MNRKHVFIATILLVDFVASICIYYWFTVGSSRTYVGILQETLQIRNVGWNLSLARAVFNFTAIHTNMAPAIMIEHVEVDGTRVDSYPVEPSLKPGESILIRVYYQYNHNSTYHFTVCTEQGSRFPINCKSPPG